MDLKDFFFNYFNKNFEKRFLKALAFNFKKDNLSDSEFILEEIQQKTPLIFKSYIDSSLTKGKAEISHIRIASFLLSVFSSIRIHYKDTDLIKKIIEDISSHIFYKEIRFLLLLAFIFSKNRLIAFWNYFFLLQDKFIAFFFDKSIEITKDYKEQKIVIKLNPITYKSFFTKHRLESLIFPSISYFNAIIKVIEKNYPELEIHKDEDPINFNQSYLISYKS